MLRISKLTDYGTVVLACLAAMPEQRLTASEVAERTKLGLPTVSKLLKCFHRAGIVTSTRGMRGGYQLARPATGISAAAIIDAIEGPVAITECSSNHSACDRETSCSTGNAWQRINRRDPALTRRDFAGSTGGSGSRGRLAPGTPGRHARQPAPAARPRAYLRPMQCP